MKVILFCCKGFEMMEFAPFYDVMGWAKSEYDFDIEVKTCGFNRSVSSAFWKVEIKVDKVITEINTDDYAALVIPGGDHLFGYFEEAYDERFLQLIRDFDTGNKLIASVCVGALPIGKSGVLKGRRATTYHLMDGHRQKQLAEFGVDVIDEPVVIDSNIITSYCPQTADEVAFTLLEKLLGREKTSTVKRGMGYE